MKLSKFPRAVAVGLVLCAMFIGALLYFGPSSAPQASAAVEKSSNPVHATTQVGDRFVVEHGVVAPQQVAKEPVAVFAAAKVRPRPVRSTSRSKAHKWQSLPLKLPTRVRPPQDADSTLLAFTGPKAREKI